MWKVVGVVVASTAMIGCATQTVGEPFQAYPPIAEDKGQLIIFNPKKEDGGFKHEVQQR